MMLQSLVGVLTGVTVITGRFVLRLMNSGTWWIWSDLSCIAISTLQRNYWYADEPVVACKWDRFPVWLPPQLDRGNPVGFLLGMMVGSIHSCWIWLADSDLKILGWLHENNHLSVLRNLWESLKNLWGFLDDVDDPSASNNPESHTTRNGTQRRRKRGR